MVSFILHKVLIGIELQYSNYFAANLKVSSFDLILSLEFLLKIAQFMAVPEDPNAPKQTPVVVKTVKRKTNENKYLETFSQRI